MSYQISNIGIGIIAVYSFVVLLVITWPLAKLFRKFRWKWAVIAPPTFALLAAPWAEEYWIASHFAQACQDAGVHVYKKVEVEGFYDETIASGYELINRYGYQFIEHKGDGGKIEHIEKKDGQWRKQVLDYPTAHYHYKYAYQPTPYKTEERIGWKLEKLGTVVVDSKTGEVIGRDTEYRRTINIAEGSWRLFWGLAKTTCRGSAPNAPDLRYPLYHYVLMPAKH